MKPNRLVAGLVSVLMLANAVPAAAEPTVPKGFLPASTSWQTDRQGSVLGYAPCASSRWCPYLLQTTNGGASWLRKTAPSLALPENHNQVKLSVVNADDAFASDGTGIWATNDGARSWYRVAVSGVREPFYISQVTKAQNRVFAVVNTLGNAERDGTTIYSGTRVLRPVPGLTVTGGITYGDIAVDGDIQVSLGANFETAKYWLSRNGTAFTPAPAACPASTFASLAGVRQGKPIALCSGSGGSPSPGTNTKQVFTAPNLGGEFTGSAPAPDAGITQSFAAASTRTITIAAVIGGEGLLHSTFDGGATWATTDLSDRGFALFDLQYPSPRVGFVVDGEPNAGGSAVFRTTDGGHTWKELTFS
jgi:hypothetical protein